MTVPVETREFWLKIGPGRNFLKQSYAFTPNEADVDGLIKAWASKWDLSEIQLDQVVLFLIFWDPSIDSHPKPIPPDDQLIELETSWKITKDLSGIVQGRRADVSNSYTNGIPTGARILAKLPPKLGKYYHNITLMKFSSLI
jgi:hypothetical protein